MSGFTAVHLKNKSEENIAKANKSLDAASLRKDIRFYSEKDVEFEYEAFKKGEGVFPEHQFPRNQINSYEDFKRYWSTESLGEIFCPHFGSLTFDCYFGRTSNRAMRILGQWIADNHNLIEKTSGSFSTFMERGMTKLERKIIEESTIKDEY